MYNVQNVTASHLQKNLTQREYLKWINAVLNTSYKKMDDLSTGSAYCRIVNQVFPGCIDAKKIKKDEDCKGNISTSTKNFQLLSESFRSLGVKILIKGGPCQGDVTSLEISKLVKPTLCVPVNYKFIQWFKIFCDENSNEIKELPIKEPATEKREILSKTMKNKVPGTPKCGKKLKMPQKALKQSVTVSNTDHKIEHIEIIDNASLTTEEDVKMSSFCMECLDSDRGNKYGIPIKMVMSESDNLNGKVKQMQDETKKKSQTKERKKIVEEYPTSKEIHDQSASSMGERYIKIQQSVSEDALSTVKKSISLNADTIRDESQFMEIGNDNSDLLLIEEANGEDRQDANHANTLGGLDKTGNAIKGTSEETDEKTNDKMEAIKKHMLNVRERIKKGEKPANYTLRSSKSMNIQTISEKEKLKIILRELRASRKSRNEK